MGADHSETGAADSLDPCEEVQSATRDKPPSGTVAESSVGTGRDTSLEVHRPVQISYVFAAAGSPQPNTLPATTPSTELHSSITVVTTLKRAFSLDTCSDVQLRHFLIDWQEVDVVLVGLQPARSPRGQRGRRNNLLRRDAVDFHAFQAL